MKNKNRFNCLFSQKGDTYKLFINDVIYKEDYYGKSETSSDYVIQKINEIPAGATLEVHINSDGGDVIEATTIYNTMMDAPIKTVGIVDGHAYSAAAFILQACDDRIMNPGTTLLVHNAWTIAIGNAEDLRAAADDLDKLMESNRKLFLEKCTLNEEELIALLAEDKILTPEDALGYGFIDRIGRAEEDPGEEEEPEDEPVPEEDPEEEPEEDPEENEPEEQAIRSDRIAAAAKFFKQFY